ncbi:MAG: rod shape-determining protein MreD [Longimicrobiales bacterium]
MKGLMGWVAGGLMLAHLVLHVGFGWGRGAPDLFTLTLLIASRRLHVGAAAGVGFGLGLIEDAFSALSFGANTFAMTVTGVLGSRSRDFLVGDSLNFLFFYFLAGKWTRDILVWIVSEAAVRTSLPTRVFLEAPVAGLYMAVIGVGVVYLMRRRWVAAE